MSTALSESGRQQVAKACAVWREKLVDLSRRNPLLYYLPRKASTLEFELPNPETVRRLLSGPAVRITDLCAAADAPARAVAAHERRKENFEERGLSTLHVGFGIATWAAADGGRPPAAPVLLLPVMSSRDRRGSQRVDILATGELHLNPLLVSQLQRETGTLLDEEGLRSEIGLESPPDLELVFKRLRALLGANPPGFAIQSTAVLANFSFQKHTMVRDLEESSMVMESPIVAALAGVVDAQVALTPTEVIELRDLDRRPVRDDKTVLDADSSQARVVAAASGGQSGVIQGPPGCGKSQTIVNLIAALVADGKRVLFVAEKRAAIDVVRRRLEQVGLGGLAVDLAGGSPRKGAFGARISGAMKSAKNAPSGPRVDARALDGTLEARRGDLVAHVGRIHVERPPTGASLLSLQGELLALLRRGQDPRTRWRPPELMALDRDALDRARLDLVALASESSLFVGETQTLWQRASLERSDQLQRAMAVVDSASEALDAVREGLGAIIGLGRSAGSLTVSEARGLERTLNGLLSVLARLDASVLAEELEGLSSALAPVSRGWLARLWAFFTSAEYRRAIRLVRGLAVDPSADVRQLAATVDDARRLYADWRTVAGPSPVPSRVTATGALDTALAQAERLLSEASRLFSLDSGERLEQLSAAFDAIRREVPLARRLHVVQARSARIRAAGFGPFLEEVRRTQPGPPGWPDGLCAAWFGSWVEHIHLSEPGLSEFSGRAHERVAHEFRQLDRERLVANTDRIRVDQAERFNKTKTEYPGQYRILESESERTGRKRPLRTLVGDAPDVLMTLFPCWMASPLAVSESLPPIPGLFDVVVFDEASQVLPEDAIAALARGKAVIVAGDRHQLPPTTFFADGQPDAVEGSEDSDVATEGFESLLDVLSTFLQTWSLDWHYRSRDERLIAYSNQQVYDGRLVTFPSVGVASSIRHEYVPWRWDQGAGQALSGSDEVARVADLVREHARSRPDESLGIITLGIEHQKRVEAAIDRATDEDPILAAFWDREDRDERAFVKNLERVQGDERDAIILSLGYSKDATGRLPLRFGPVNQQGGYRRLNVAVTRARRRMTLVSSFTHHDLDPVQVQGRRGLEFLRGYLEFAAHGGNRDTDRGLTGFPVNAFEADVQAALEGAGLSVVPQLGVSSYRLDLAVRHPRQPGRFVLAVECDGASYHSAPTARDRDRLRQEHLEALGWRFCRVWSTDWFRRRADELARVLTAYHEAVAHADAADAREEAERVAARSAPPSGALGSAPPMASSRPPMVASSPPTASSTGASSPPLAGSSPPMAMPSPTERGPRPPVEPGRSIDAYAESELDALARWVRADGLRRTDAEVAEEVFGELGFKRRGARIVAALEAAARRTRG